MDVLFKNIRRIIMKNIGFTLVELLIVITIISTLSGIGFAVFGNATRNARDAKRKADLEQIRTALEMYKADNGRYPQAGGCAYGQSGGCYVYSTNGSSWIPAL